MYQSGRAGDEAKKCKSPAKSGRVGITAKGTELSVHIMEKIAALDVHIIEKGTV